MKRTSLIAMMRTWLAFGDIGQSKLRDDLGLAVSAHLLSFDLSGAMVVDAGAVSDCWS
jgi:hypothetical protein